MTAKPNLLTVLGVVLLAIALQVGFDLEAAWYWWLAFGISIALIKNT